MPDEFEEVADRMWKRMKEPTEKLLSELRECNTEECRRAREAVLNGFKDGDMQSLKEVQSLRTDIGKLLEEIEKVRSEPVEMDECPSCHFHGTEKPPNVGKCPNGCVKYNKFDKERGAAHCMVCGDEIEWDNE